MPYRKSLSIVLIALASAALGLSLRFFNTSVSFIKEEPYPKLWKKVDSCENKGLTESALKIVEVIYQRSKTENNAPQFVRSVIYKMKLVQNKEEFSQEKNINDLSQEAQAATFPAKPVLQSLLADAYWQYYQSNRWKFYNRTETVNFDKKDIATYDLKALVNASIANYKASIRDTALLKQTKIDLFEEIITPGTAQARVWRPTLYDFLAHRALDFYKNSEAAVTKAASQFAINDEAYLKPYTEFLKMKVVKAQDSLDMTYYAVMLFRDLMNYKIKSGNEDGLVDLDMERLAFANNNSKNPLKDSLYLQTLKWMENKFEKSSRIAEIKHLTAQWWFNGSQEYKALEDQKLKWNKKKAFEICNNIIKTYPKSRGAQLARNTINSIQTKALHITAEDVNDVQLPNRVLVDYTNIQKLYFKLVKTDFFSYQKLVNKYYDKDLLTRIMNMPVALTFEQGLPVDPDFNPHAVEAKIPAMENGYYILIASDSPQFAYKESVISYQPYCVSDIAYLHKRKPAGGYDFYVMNRQTGKPLKNVNAQVWQNIYNYKSNEYEVVKGVSAVSDESGYFFLESKDKEGYNYHVELTNGKDKLVSAGNFYNYREYDNKTPVTRSFIFTDRAIYRPGQTIYFKSILLRGLKNKSEIIPGQHVNIIFYDVNHQQIASQNLTTNEYGTVSGSFVAPQGVLTGQMQITDGYGTASISVEEYKRPKFEVLFDTLKGSYKLNEEMSVRGFAKAYAGNMIDNAEVKYRVVRRVNYPDWWYWYRPFYTYRSEEVEIANGFTKTNDLGYFDITFKAVPDPTADEKSNPVYTYEIFADVTDLNGETRSTSSNFRVGYKTLELQINCPEVINTSALPAVSIRAVNLNGVEDFATVQLSVFELKQPSKVFRKRLWSQPDKHIYSREEYYKLFPNDLYEDENNQYTWEKNKKAFSKEFNTKAGKTIDASDFKNLQPGVYMLEAICKDKSGEEVKDVKYITVYNPASDAMPVKAAQWTYGLKQSAEPNEKASFIVASAYKDVSCLYEVEGEQRKEIKFITPDMKPLEIAVSEADRGGISATTHFIKFGRIYSATHYINVPFTNKDLVIEYASFRNKLLPGQKEEWTLTVKNKKGDKAAAEMVASLYDASLDAYRPNYWAFNIYNNFYATPWTHSLEQSVASNQMYSYRGDYTSVDPVYYDQLNYFGLNYYSRYYGNRMQRSPGRRDANFSADKDDSESEKSMMSEAAAPRMEEKSAKKSVGGVSQEAQAKTSPQEPKKEDLAGLPARSNFNETAFFFPQLQTNEKGEVIIKFTIPESLTKWKFMGLAHTKDLSFGQIQNEVVTQKELMVVPNAPRFFRENDKMSFTAKVSNLSQFDLPVSAELKMYDAFTEQDITSEIITASENNKNFMIKKGVSSVAQWNISIPEKYQAIKYRVVAKAANFSDGEEMVVPVLTNRMLVTESMPLPVRGNQTKEFNFTKFINQNNNSTTLKNHAYTLEFTANPAWYAVQSLPYLMEYPYECAEQVFARYYSNVLASYIVKSKPKITQIFEAWKTKSPEAFLSNLEKNQELKSLLLEETPWVLDSKNETESKKRVALLFDMNKMSNELNSALNKLEKMQTSNGGWPWFSGCPEDWYISQHIVTGFAHLQKLGVIDLEKDERIARLVKAAAGFCDRKLQEHYVYTKRNHSNYEKENHLDYMAIQYLYMRSYFKDAANVNKEAVAYYKKQTQKYWVDNNRYMQAMLALSMNRYADKKTAGDIMKSLKENAINNEEVGMYWKENSGGYYWYQAPIETQALMIEAFDEVLNDLKSVDDLKTWLIKSKQTQNWGTTRATTEAVYALLLRGTDWLSTEPNVEISLGPIVLDPKKDPEIKAEAGTGYFKKTFNGTAILPSMGKVKVVKKDAGVSWGSVYWQYFEQLDKITPHETPLKLSKKLFIEKNTGSGPVITPLADGVQLKVGDKVKVRIELRSDRDLEYVHLKDMRAAGFEPVNVMSAYRYQDGLGYYESTKDAATNFFISYLPKGTYVFEYPVLVTHNGDFSNGVSTVQCMYAPEFTSHSEGIRVKVGK